MIAHSRDSRPDSAQTSLKRFLHMIGCSSCVGTCSRAPPYHSKRKRTHDLDWEPRQIRRLAVSAHVYCGLLRDGLCARETDRERRRFDDSPQHRVERDAFSDGYCGPTTQRGWIYLCGPGFVRSVEGGEPAARLADGVVDRGRDSDCVFE